MKKSLLSIRKVLHKNNLPVTAVPSFPSYLFNFHSLLKILLVTGLMIFCLQVFAQPGTEKQESDYRKVITERSAKIVNILEITDSGKYNEVLTDIVNQYSQLNTIDEQGKEAISEVKKQSLPKESTDDVLKKAEEKKSFRLKQLHTEFIAHLKENLTDEQIEKVKDGMTYRVFPITYAAYQDMLPNLTKEQKEKIYGWLKEARELAMDEGSSERKHAVFGKYKGRINNYLSAEGYDLKKETEDWQKRVKEREAKAKKQESS